MTSGDSVDSFFLDAYRELRCMARSRLPRNESLALLDTHALVHECYLRMRCVSGHPDLKERTQLIAYASATMRAIVIDFIRRQRAQCRGSGEASVTLDIELAESLPADDDHLPDVNEAIEALASVEPRLRMVVEMRYFGGLAESEIACALGVTDRTVRRDWERARQLLRASLSTN